MSAPQVPPDPTQQPDILSQPALTHDEIWDDSSLLSAWDDALAEYKRYHSIAATGADADALMRAAEEELGLGSGDVTGTGTELEDIQLEDVLEDEAEVCVDVDLDKVEGAEAEVSEDGPARAQQVRSSEPSAAVNGKIIEPGLIQGLIQDSTIEGGEPFSGPAPSAAEVEVEIESESATAGADAAQTGMAAPPLPPLPQMSQSFVVGGSNEALRNLMMSWYWAGYYTGFYEGQQAGANGDHAAKDQPPAA